MKELKFKEVDDRYNMDLANGIKFKPYYTLDEKFEIYSLMSAQGNAFNVDMALIVGTAKACTNIDFEGLDDKEIYNVISENQLIASFECEVDGYYTMPKLIERDNSVSELIKPIMVELEDKLKNLDMNKFQGLLGGVLNNVKTNKKSN